MQRIFGDRREEVVPRRLGGLEVSEHELRLVVEHLLEVRHAPLGIDGVAMEAAADLIAHPAQRHRPQRFSGHLPRRLRAGARVLAQQEQQFRWAWKLRRLAEAAETRIERAGELGDRRIQRRGLADLRFGLRAHRLGTQTLGQLRRRLVDARTVLLPHAREFPEQVR